MDEDIKIVIVEMYTNLKIMNKNILKNNFENWNKLVENHNRYNSYLRRQIMTEKIYILLDVIYQKLIIISKGLFKNFDVDKKNEFFLDISNDFLNVLKENEEKNFGINLFNI